MNWYTFLISTYTSFISCNIYQGKPPLKLQYLYARTNQYSYSFLPRTIRNWNNLNIANIDNIDLETFKCSL